jgi:hypothetical protein
MLPDLWIFYPAAKYIAKLWNNHGRITVGTMAYARMGLLLILIPGFEVS